MVSNSLNLSLFVVEYNNVYWFTVPRRRLSIFYGPVTNLLPHLVASCADQAYTIVMFKNMIKRKYIMYLKNMRRI